MKIMSFYKVHNLHEDRPGNWVEYWEKATGQKAGLCHSVDCQDFPTKATDGAHVQLDGFALILKNKTLKFSCLDCVDDLEEGMVESSGYFFNAHKEKVSLVVAERMDMDHWR